MLTNIQDDTVSEINTVNVGSGPNGIDVHPQDTFVYVTNSNSDTVSEINTATLALTTITVGDDPSSFGLLIQPLRQATTVPTMNECGMIVFIILAGIGTVYFMRRQRPINS
jgi:YVTN family beta-propeller protein